MNAEAAAKYFKQGFDLVAVGADIHFLWTGAESALHALQSATERIGV
jgi:2-keto-3-deoxy-L-rhamnonate aldolase RhmA